MKSVSRWLIPTLIAAVIVAAVGAGYFLSRPQTDALYASVAVTATAEDGQGVLPQSGFAVSSRYSIKEADLRAMLDVEPDLEYTLSGSGKNWTLTPSAPLLDNTVYTIQVKNPAGDVVQSFAFQTRSDLLVGATYPADEEGYVEPESGIEITFNAPDVDLSAHFGILPEISGKFEASGYTSVFIPDEPLAQNSIYRVTLRAGLRAPNGMTLKEDYTFSFETSNAQDDKDDYRRLRLAGDYAETFLPGDPLAVGLSSGVKINGNMNVTVHRYPDINAYLRELQAYGSFYEERYGAKTDYVAATAGLEEVFSYQGKLFQKTDYWGDLYAILPDELGEGHYIVTISGQDDEGNNQFVQKLLQICNLSLYTQSVEGDTLFWVNDPVSGEPVADASLRLTEAVKDGRLFDGVTTADGIAKISTGKTEEAYLEVVRNGKLAYVEKVRLSGAKDAPVSERYYTALYTDREIYQPNDSIKFWGVVKPRRQGNSLPKSVYAELTGSWPENTVYKLKAAVNEDGTFIGEMPITGIKKDWYSFKITNGEEADNTGGRYEAAGVYTSKGFLIEEYTKPPYAITVKADKDWYYANEQVRFSVSASYFDGTPVSGGRLRFSSYQLGLMSDDEKGIITLDEAGQGSITLSYVPDGEALSWNPMSVWYEVSNADPEDVYVFTSGSVRMLPSQIAVEVDSAAEGKLTVRAAQIDVSKLGEAPQVRPLKTDESEFDRLAGAPADLPLTATVHKVQYVQTPVGSYYDPVNKRTVTRYESNRVESVEDTRQISTVGGTAVLDYPYESTTDTYYRLELTFDGQVIGQVQEMHSLRPYYFSPNSDGEKRYSFTSGESFDSNRLAVPLGETIPLGLYENGRQIQPEGRVLYSTVQRKTLSTALFEGGAASLTMGEQYLPNVVIVGAYFDGRHVYLIENLYVTYDYTGQELTVQVKPTAESYRPGENAVVELTVTDAQGSPAAASVCIGVVDEAVFAIAGQEIDLAAQIYGSIYHPSVEQGVSYSEYALDEANPATAGGVGTGGGGDGVTQVREEFVDTASFQTVVVDATGKAAVEVKLPDNITSWRVTACAVTSDPLVKAGSGVSNAVATLPFYLQVLHSDSYLEGDDVSMTLQSIGTEVTLLSGQAEYTITVHKMDGTEIDRLTASGKPGERVQFNFGKYDAGQYYLQAAVKCGSLSDAVKQEFAVIRQGLTVPVIRSMPLSELSGLSSVRYPVRMLVYDHRMTAYMDGVQKLAGQSGSRTEVLVAAYRTQVAYNELLDPSERMRVYKDERLEQIQGESGVKLLPVSEPDAAVTAKMLAAAPDQINRSSARTFLQEVLKDPAATPDDRVMAQMGLAAAGEPVLLDITRMLEEPTLTAAQKLYLGVGLAKLGDFTGAEKVYASLGGQIVAEGDLKYVETGGTFDERVQNTAAALMLTSITSNPDADALMRYLNLQNTNRRASTTVLYNLEQLAYIENFTIPAGSVGAKFSYLRDGEKQTVDLSGKGWEAISMSYEALTAAQFEGGKDVYVSAAYTGYADASGAADNSKVKVTKSYTPVSGDEIGIGSRVRVSVRVEFAEDAPSGCYIISDYIPSGMRFLPMLYDSRLNPAYDWCWGNVENEGQTVRGYIYLDRGELPQPVPYDSEAEEEELLEEGIKINPGTEEAAVPVTDSEMEFTEGALDSYTLTYYVNAAMAGDFVTESAYVTPPGDGLAAKSPRGKIVIQ